MQRPSNCPVTTPFGYVKGYPLNGGYHMGVDFAYIPDNVIYAPEDGNYRLYPNNGSLGNAIHMWVGNRHHAFGHTSKYLITDNQFCKRGTPIAIMGETGAAQGVHLHWALAINGALVDPLSQVNESFIKGDDMKITELLADAMYLLAFNRHIDAAGKKVTVGGDIAQQQDRIRKSTEYQNRLKKINNYDAVVKERDALKAQLADSSEANLLGQALIKLLATFGYKKG